MKNPAERGKNRFVGLIYSLFCAQTIPEKLMVLMKWGSRILLGLTPKSLCYRISGKKLREMTKYDLADCEMALQIYAQVLAT